MKIKILIVEDHRGTAEAYRAALKDTFEVVGIASNGEQAETAAARLNPDVILMDVMLSNHLEGIESIRKICAKNPSTKVLILSTWLKEYWLAEAMAAGARGYALKGDSLNELVRKIEMVYSGQVVKPWLPDTHEPLSEREIKIVKFIDEGLSYEQIGGRLRLAMSTIKTEHIPIIFDKLGVHDREAAIKRARELGYLPP